MTMTTTAAAVANTSVTFTTDSSRCRPGTCTTSGYLRSFSCTRIWWLSSFLFLATTCSRWCCYAFMITTTTTQEGCLAIDTASRRHRRLPFSLLLSNQRQLYTQQSPSESSSGSVQKADLLKKDLFLILDSIPANAPTPPETTEKILNIVRQLENKGDDDEGDMSSNNSDSDDIDDGERDTLIKLGGTWELLWTAQDRSSNQYNEQEFWKTFIK
jgi:hypothetical protein